MLKKLFLSLCLACALLGTVSASESTLAGGYQETSVHDQAVLDAAHFAAEQINQGTLVSVVSAQSQVVAGINYKLVLELEVAGGINHIFNVVVFVPLPVENKPMQLTSYQDLGTVNSAPK